LLGDATKLLTQYQKALNIQNVKQKAEELSQADFSWFRSGFFLNSQRVPGAEATVTLICFGAPLEIERRFKVLALNLAWEKVLQDPFVLFYIIFDELYLQLDSVVWKLGKVFGGMEFVSLIPRSFRMLRPQRYGLT